MNLADTQATLIKALTSFDAKHSTDAETMIRGGDGLSPSLSLGVFRNNILGARTAALSVAYPACHRILGVDCFVAVARSYAKANPSTSVDLNLYGGAFWRFLGDLVDRDLRWKDYLYLADLASLEWSCHVARFAPEDPVFDFEKFKSMSTCPDSLSFRVNSSLGLVRSKYPVQSIREVNLGQEVAREVSSDFGENFLVVWRGLTTVRVDRVDESAFAVLSECRLGSSLSDILKKFPNWADQLPVVLPTFVEKGWITDVEETRSSI